MIRIIFEFRVYCNLENRARLQTFDLLSVENFGIVSAGYDLATLVLIQFSDTEFWLCFPLFRTLINV